jgi:hypothetical protein
MLETVAKPMARMYSRHADAYFLCMSVMVYVYWIIFTIDSYNIRIDYLFIAIHILISVGHLIKSLVCLDSSHKPHR